MIRLLLVAEIHEASTIEEARLLLDNFREAVLPSQNYDITLYEVTADDVQEIAARPDLKLS